MDKKTTSWLSKGKASMKLLRLLFLLIPNLLMAMEKDEPPLPIKTQIITAIKQSNTIEGAIIRLRKLSETNNEFNSILAIDQMIRELINRFAKDTNKDPLIAAIALDTQGSHEWLIENDHGYWMSEVKYILKHSLDDISENILITLMLNDQFAHYFSGQFVIHGTQITALQFAISVRFFNLTTTLLNAGADPNIANGNGLTPLSMAAADNQLEIVQQLLNANASVDQANTHGTTALMIAAQRGFLPIVNLLLSYGADPFLINRNGMQAIDLARQAGNNSIVDALEKAEEDWFPRLSAPAA